MDDWSDAHEVVDFWRKAGAGLWFAKNTKFDNEFRRLFMELHFAAARRECEHWMNDPNAQLALILLLDQFPRNAFRATAHMYATDSLARFYARNMIDSGRIVKVEEALRLFVCVPFMHSEDLNDQRYSLDLCRHHAPSENRYAVEHCEIIRRFGRFPHRNVHLGRLTTAEEQDFLDQGGFSG